MPLYQYVKAAPLPIYRKKPVGISFLFMGVGVGILLWVLWPIFSFALTSDVVFSNIVTPIADVAKTGAIGSGALSPVAFAAGSSNGIVAENADTSNANAWYPTAPQKHTDSSVNTYFLSIPKLKIENATVTISGDDLDKSLVHYGGTGLPGQYGTAVVFGHSELPQFFSSTNYKSIFSLLPTLKIGDKILVNYDGVDYSYSVYDMTVLQPTDLSALEQHFDDSYLTLVTCVPPGTLWARLNVRAKLDTL